MTGEVSSGPKNELKGKKNSRIICLNLGDPCPKPARGMKEYEDAATGTQKEFGILSFLHSSHFFCLQFPLRYWWPPTFGLDSKWGSFANSRLSEEVSL